MLQVCPYASGIFFPAQQLKGCRTVKDRDCTVHVIVLTNQAIVDFTFEQLPNCLLFGVLLECNNIRLKLICNQSLHPFSTAPSNIPAM